MAEQGIAGERQSWTEDETGRDTQSRQHQNLDEINRKNIPAGGAERAKHGDRPPLLVEIARNRIGDARATDEQRRQSHERQKLPEPVDRPARARRRVAAIGDAEAGIGERGAYLIPNPLEFRCAEPLALWDQQAIGPARQTAGLGEAGGAKCIQRNQHARTERRLPSELVRLPPREAS